MKHNFYGRTIIIPDNEIDNYVEKLDLSINDAIELWLEDNGYQENAEQIALDNVASGVKIPPVIGGDSKEKKTRIRVASDEKQTIFNLLTDTLSDFFAENNGNYEVLTKNKKIQINFNEKTLVIDLVERRTPKNAEN